MCLLSCSRGSGIRNCHEGFKAKVEKLEVKMRSASVTLLEARHPIDRWWLCHPSELS